MTKKMATLVKEVHRKHPKMPMPQVFKAAGKKYRAQKKK
jgi:hypothetical protein